jgi:hypothetical protein
MRCQRQQQQQMKFVRNLEASTTPAAQQVLDEGAGVTKHRTRIITCRVLMRI